MYMYSPLLKNRYNYPISLQIAMAVEIICVFEKQEFFPNLKNIKHVSTLVCVYRVKKLCKYQNIIRIIYECLTYKYFFSDPGDRCITYDINSICCDLEKKYFRYFYYYYYYYYYYQFYYTHFYMYVLVILVCGVRYVKKLSEKDFV